MSEFIPALAIAHRHRVVPSFVCVIHAGHNDDRFGSAKEATTSTAKQIAAFEAAVKSIIRQHGAERDRRAVLRVSFYLMRVWHEGIHNTEHLIARYWQKTVTDLDGSLNVGNISPL